MKKAKARNPAAARLTRKMVIMAGTMGPTIMVSKEITKKVRNTKLTVQRLLTVSCLSLSQLIVACPATPGLAGLVWQMAVARGDTSRRPTDSLLEAMVPDPRCTYEIGVLSQGSQCQLRFFIRNEPATLANDFADTIKKESRTLHHTATHNDHVRHE